MFFQEIVMGFLPQSYEPPQTGNYFKFAPGKNRFRILGAAIVGNVFWRSKGEGREPVRRRMNEKIAASELELNPKSGEPEKVKHFWCFPVWSYAAKSVQIMELTQKSIMGAIQALVDEADWGDPVNYDLIVSKSGSGLETEYATQPAPSKPLDPTITEAYAATPINLEALFSNGDPFSANGNGHKPAAGASIENGTPAPIKPSPAAGAAKQKAWQTYRKLFPTQPLDEVQEGFRQAFAKYFPGRQVDLVTAANWEAFILDSFEKPKPANPIGAESEFALDEIPF